MTSITYTILTPEKRLTLHTFCGWERPTRVAGVVEIGTKRLLSSDEGFRWIRGAHDETTEEGKALLAAASLSGALPLYVTLRSRG